MIRLVLCTLHRANRKSGIQAFDHDSRPFASETQFNKRLTTLMILARWLKLKAYATLLGSYFLIIWRQPWDSHSQQRHQSLLQQQQEKRKRGHVVLAQRREKQETNGNFSLPVIDQKSKACFNLIIYLKLQSDYLFINWTVTYRLNYVGYVQWIIDLHFSSTIVTLSIIGQG